MYTFLALKQADFLRYSRISAMTLVVAFLSGKYFHFIGCFIKSRQPDLVRYVSLTCFPIQFLCQSSGVPQRAPEILWYYHLMLHKTQQNSFPDYCLCTPKYRRSSYPSFFCHSCQSEAFIKPIGFQPAWYSFTTFWVRCVTAVFVFHNAHSSVSSCFVCHSMTVVYLYIYSQALIYIL